MASKRKSVCIDEKVSLIRAIEKGDKKSDVAKRFGFSPSTVSTIWKNKEKFLQAEMDGKSSKKLKKPKFEDLDQSMLTWFRKQRQNNMPVSGPIMKAKAEKFAEQLSITDFKASEGWLGKFKQRHCINFGKVNGEARNVDTNVTHNLIKEVWLQFKEKVNNKPKSAVWSFFKYVNYEKTVCACVHCKKEFRVVDGLENMKKHLLEEHPEALLHHKSDDDPLFLTTSTETDMEASDDDNLQVDFLDFYDVRSSRDPRPSCTQSSTSERERGRRTRKPSIYRSPSRSVTQTKPPESLEHFANYVTYLLQELPEKVSKRLQMNFVKQIIEAQISCDEMKNAATETVVNTTSTVADTVPDDNVKIIVDEYTVSEEMTTANIEKSDGTVTISNGITIRPIRMQ